MENKKIDNLSFVKLKQIVSNIRYVLKLLTALEKKYLYLKIFFSICVTTIPFITLLIFQSLLNELQSGTSGIETMIGILCAYIVVQFIGVIVSILNTFYSGKYQEYISCELSKYFDMLCTELSLRDFETDDTYNLIQRAEYEMGMRPNIVLNNILNLANGIIGLSLSILILVQWHLWVLIGFVILPIASFKYFRKISDLEYKTLYERVNIQRKSWYLTYLLTRDYYIKEVKSLGLSHYLLESKFEIKDILYDQNIDILKRKGMFKSRYQFLTFLFLFVILLTALWEAFYKIILIGNFMTYINTTMKVEKHIGSITDSLFALYTDNLYTENIVSFVEYAKKNASKKSENNKGVDIQRVETIEFKNISYKYPNSSEYVLKNVNFKICAGDIVGLVGENGSGKTTLTKILLGLYDDYEGELLINGIDIKNIEYRKYLEKISSIFQDYNNYEFTVMDNIRFGDIENNPSKEKIHEASKITGSDEFINKLDKKYDQQVGNWFAGGVQLSGGQWQKLALSRAIIRDADLYIFDEPTAALDPLSEYTFFRNMIGLFKGKIGIFITHRFINAKVANKILVFKNGCVVENGNHEELMRIQGYYYSLYTLQQTGFKNNEK